MFDKIKRYLILMREENGSYIKIKAIEIKNASQKEVKYGKNKTFAINLRKPTYTDKLKRYYYHDIDTMAPIPLIPQAPIITPEILDQLLSDKLVKDVSESMRESSFTMEIKNLIIGGLTGAGIMGFVLMILFYTGVL